VKHAFLNVAGAAVLAAGMAFAQNAPAQNSPHAGRHGAQAGSMIDRLSARLNLTDAQKQQAQSIFAEARKSAQPVRDQIRQDKQALAAAMKSGSQADIDRISNNMGPPDGASLGNPVKGVRSVLCDADSRSEEQGGSAVQPAGQRKELAMASPEFIGGRSAFRLVIDRAMERG